VKEKRREKEKREGKEEKRKKREREREREREKEEKKERESIRSAISRSDGASAHPSAVTLFVAEPELPSKVQVTKGRSQLDRSII